MKAGDEQLRRYFARVRLPGWDADPCRETLPGRRVRCLLNEGHASDHFGCPDREGVWWSKQRQGELW